MKLSILAHDVAARYAAFAHGATTYPEIEWANEHLKSVFGRHSDQWDSDWKLWIGLGMWLGTWSHNVLEKRWADGDASFMLKFIWALGLDLVVLHLVQYYDGWGLVIAVTLLAIQNLVRAWATWPEIIPKSKFTFTTENIYQDLSVPMSQVSVILIGQMGLFACYTMYLYHNIGNVSNSYAFWLLAVICVQMAGLIARGSDSLLGAHFNMLLWLRICEHGDYSKFTCISGTAKDKLIEASSFVLHVRGIMGFLVNSIMRDFMAFTIPLLLMHFDDPLSFVVYSIGVNFITKLDDASEKEFVVDLTDGKEGEGA